MALLNSGNCPLRHQQNPTILAEIVLRYTGADEGGFAWLTLNYLLGHLGKPEDKTIAAIDLGGGSVQQAFAVPPAEAKKAPAGYITELSGGGRAYNVYVHR